MAVEEEEEQIKHLVTAVFVETLSIGEEPIFDVKLSLIMYLSVFNCSSCYREGRYSAHEIV